jgi:hypothetical protein
MQLPVEFVGTWEEVSQHASELAGRLVRLTVLGDEMRETGTSKRSGGPQVGRLPDPPLESPEQPLPFDLPRPGGGTAVPFREGKVRLPDPPCLPEPE